MPDDEYGYSPFERWIHRWLSIIAIIAGVIGLIGLMVLAVAPSA